MNEPRTTKRARAHGAANDVRGMGERFWLVRQTDPPGLGAGPITQERRITPIGGDNVIELRPSLNSGKEHPRIEWLGPIDVDQVRRALPELFGEAVVLELPRRNQPVRGSVTEDPPSPP